MEKFRKIKTIYLFSIPGYSPFFSLKLYVLKKIKKQNFMRKYN